MNNTSSFTQPRPDRCPTTAFPELHLTSPFHGMGDDKHFIISIIVINVFVAIASICSNALIIWTFYRTSSLRIPSNLLILGLAISDFSIGVFVHPAYCISKYFEVIKDISRFCLTRDIKIINMTAFGSISFLFISAIIADRFLAMKLHLRYQEFATTKRYLTVMTLIWLYSFFIAGIFPLFAGKKGNAIAVMTIYTIIVLLNIFFLFKISKVIRRHSQQIHAQQPSTQQPSTQEPSINMPRYQKSVYTIYYVIGGFVFCFSPTLIAVIVLVFEKDKVIVESVFGFSEACMMLNGVVNPIIYCWRVEGIREPALYLLRRIFRRCERQQE